jgi:hypothetical protein
MGNSTLIYPYEFEGGKKAVASQVNANFEAVKTFANGINSTIADLQEAVADLDNRPTREMFDIFYSFSSETPVGAYPLWTGETITNCKSLYPQFWKKLNQLADRSAVPTVTSSEYEEKLTTYGQCAGFYIDTLNGHVRLPKITKFISSISSLSELAKEENAGLPNITGSLRPYRMGDPSGAFYNGASGAFYHTDSKDGSSSHAQSITYFDASRSNSVYGKSSTVQVPSVKLCLYLQVANNVAEISELNVDLVIEQMEDALKKLDESCKNHRQDLEAAFEDVRHQIVEASAVTKVENLSVPVEAFVADSTYAAYPYKADVNVPEALEEHFPTVVFALVDTESGNFASVAMSGAGYVRIYAKKVPQTTLLIPSILLQ